MSFQKLAVVGSGQIGTSVAMAATLAQPGLQIICYDNVSIEKSFAQALFNAGLKDYDVQFTTNPADISGSNLVVLATPVSKFSEAVATIAPYTTNATVFTDVGSVKDLSRERIRTALNQHIGEGTSYVPFHILNGNAGSGPETAAANIFKAPGALVPGHADPVIESQVEAFWQSLGTTVHKMTSQKHDQIFGTASHLEHTIVFSFMKTEAVKELFDQRGNIDPGNWVQAITRIAVAGPEMWAGNFYDNRDQILKTAAHFRQSLVEFANLATKSDPSLSTKVDELHEYAKDKKSTRITPFEIGTVDGHDTRMSAFVGLISLAIASNVQRVEKETGQSIVAIANPSLKDGLGPVAIDPANVKDLLNRHAQDIKPMIEDFLHKFDQTIALIETRDSASVRQLVSEVSISRTIMPKAFQGPPNILAVAARPAVKL